MGAPRAALVAVLVAAIAGSAAGIALAGALPAAPSVSPATPTGTRVSVLHGPPSEVVGAVEAAVTRAMTQLGIPGISLALGGAGELRLEAGFGFADVENEVRATPATVYRLASVSKPMTAVAALRLAATGQLDLDAAVWRYCPSYPAKQWLVTPRLLLGHQGGVRGYRPGESTQTRHFESVAEGLVLFAADPLAYEPGTEVTYSTHGYSLLGCAIEGAAGRPFAGVLRELVLDPAGMSRTQPEDLRALVPHRARGYVRGRTGELRNSPLADMSYKVPGGGLIGTAPDVARFGLALVDGRLGPVLEPMLTPQRTRAGRVTGFGLGLAVGRHGGLREAWHMGGQEQVSTVLYLRPDSGLVVAMLSNLEKVQGPLLEVARSVADLVEGDRPER